MKLIDTHTHLYLKEFDYDRNEVIENSIKAGVKEFYLPCINMKTLPSLLALERFYPGICFPMIGVHPLYIYSDNLKIEMKFIEEFLSKRKFFAIGEIGIDLFRGKSFLKEQQHVFHQQVSLAKAYDIPIIIHCREAFKETFDIIEQEKNKKLRGIFHCFTGTLDQAYQAISYGMKLGIGGMITFKNNDIKNFLKHISLEHIVLESDAPYLAPVPYRGKRNEPVFLFKILTKLSEIYDIEEKKLARITSANARQIFQNF